MTLDAAQDLNEHPLRRTSGDWHDPVGNEIGGYVIGLGVIVAQYGRDPLLPSVVGFTTLTTRREIDAYRE